MLNKDVYNLLGLATCSRNLVSGESVLISIKNKSACLVIICEDASENTRKKLIDKCTFYNVDYVIFGSSDKMSKSIGKNNRKAVSITNKNFAKKIKEKIG